MAHPGSRRARRVAADTYALTPPPGDLEAARRQVDARADAILDRIEGRDVEVPDIDPDAARILAADRDARGAIPPDEARAILRRWLDENG